MDFFNILRKKSKIIYITLLLASILNGICNFALLDFINNRIAGIALPFYKEYEWLFFIFLVTVTFTLNKTFETYMVKLTTDVRYEYHLSIHEKLKQAQLRQFENLSSARVHTAINDVNHLATLPEDILSLINSAVIILACLLYLCLNSVIAALTVLLAIISLLILYLLRNNLIERDLQIKRELENQYYRYLNDLLNGFKEIKASFSKNKNIHEKFLNKNLNNVSGIDLKTRIKYQNNELSARFSWYLVIGVILFTGPTILGLTPTTTSFFLVTILFMVGPVTSLVSSMQTYTEIKVIISRQKEFDSLLETISIAEQPDVKDFVVEPQFNELAVEAVTYSYLNSIKNVSFTMGPVDLRVRQGELVFIYGGNGSGKSTFINLITGLYRPDSGSIHLNGIAIDKRNHSFLSQHISAIFSSSFLFSENYEDYTLDVNSARLNEYVKLFKMDDIVKFNSNRRIIENDLSKGQQKRLAFIYALMEDKPILILDEWAAEQDPEFRSYFYNVILRTLQKNGKTIIAVTHDDAYFHCADRIIRFDFGRIISDSREKGVAAEIV